MTPATMHNATTPGVPGPPPPDAWRASDADREHVARTVQEATALGMLTMLEAEERLTAVYAARFRHELGPITVDLPIGQPAASASAGLLARLLGLLAHIAITTAPLRATARTLVSRHRVLTVVVALIGVALCAAVLFGGASDALLPD